MIFRDPFRASELRSGSFPEVIVSPCWSFDKWSSLRLEHNTSPHFPSSWGSPSVSASGSPSAKGCAVITAGKGPWPPSGLQPGPWPSATESSWINASSVEDMESSWETGILHPVPVKTAEGEPSSEAVITHCHNWELVSGGVSTCWKTNTPSRHETDLQK